MAQEIQFYKIRVNAVFEAHNVIFRPGVDFKVTPAIYNEAGFKDKCVSATPIYFRE